MPAENSCVPPYIFVPDRELDFLTDSHVILDILVDTQLPPCWHRSTHGFFTKIIVSIMF